MFKKIILTIIMVMMFSTSAFAFKTPYITRSSDTYGFVLKVATELYKNKSNKDSALICALKAINLCTIPYSGYNGGITIVEKHEMSEMIEEDLKKVKR